MMERIFYTVIKDSQFIVNFTISIEMRLQTCNYITKCTKISDYHDLFYINPNKESFDIYAFSIES